jgi:magnesium-protoporphyrin IX monomethyl ester (oxidative) cyclase
LSTTVRLANLVRECLPLALVVVGGLAVSIYPGVALERTGADWVIIGEGEQAFLNLVKALEGKGDIGEIRGIMGYFKGNLISNPGLDLPEDLDGIPFPARDLMPMEAYIEQKSAYWSRRRGRQTSIITSRGCPQKCTFCSVHHLSGKRWRGRSAENVLEELELLVHRYKVDSIAFLDDNFAFHRGRLKTI